MLKIMFKAWIGVFVIYLFAHLLITDYIRQSTSDALMSNGYSYLEIRRLSLPYSTLLSTETQGSLHAIMDGREVELNLHVAGNPIWSRESVIRVATPMGWTSFILGAR
ncbi:MAG: hypothetical protein ACXIVE_00115 [Salinarimonas sp.]